MDPIEAYKKAIDLVQHSNDVDEISRHLYNLAKIYHGEHDVAALAPFEEQYEKALAARDFTSILKAGSPATAKNGDLVPYDKLKAVKTLDNTKPYNRTVLVLLRHLA